MVTVGIIGAGRIGKVHTESICNYVRNARIKTVADPFMNETTEIWLRSMGVEGITKDYHEILSDPEIEAVLICSSTNTHSPISLEAIAAGKHVFCEKPIDHDLSKVKQVVQALKGSSIKYQVGFNRRHDHNFSAVKQAIMDGKVGDVHIIKITSRDPEPPSAEYAAVSGGMFLDMTIHDFDMACFLTNSDVEEVYVQSAVLVDPAIGEQGDVDTAIITLKMANGALAVIDNSRRAAYGYDQRAELFGSKGMVATSNDTLSSAVISDANGVTGEKPLFFFLERYMESFSEEMRQFVNACENGTEVPVGIHAGMQSVKIGLAAKKSVEEHRPIKL